MKKNTENNTITKNLVSLFEEQVHRNPFKIAVEFGNTSLTYGELDRRSTGLAGELQSRGVSLGSIVPLMIEKSLEMVVGIIGILKAGAAYLPVDLSIPVERVRYMIQDCGAKIVVSAPEFTSYLKNTDAEPVILSSHTVFESEIRNYPDSDTIPAYVIYTSGSTGEPKGIVTLHSNIPRVVVDTNYIDIKPSDRILQLSNYAFDGSVFDIFGALLNRATLVIPEKRILNDISLLAGFIRDRDISVFFITTALFNVLVDLEAECLAAIRILIFGGERVSLSHVKKAFEITGPGRLLHAYGPTETTVFATIHPINTIESDVHTIPIGKGITDTYLHILDENYNPLPEGCVGELYISGGGLARGYLNSPELTAGRFIRHPHVPGGRIYKTGDLVKQLPDGSLEFVGRKDSQVKIRGFRIELGDIEDCIRKNRLVKEAVALALELDLGRQLAACIVFKDTESEDIAELKDFVKQNLPYYMVPSRFIVLPSMPVTPNGKVDRKKLIDLANRENPSVPFEAPRSAEELVLTTIVEKVLGISPVGRGDSFSALGGSSISGMAVVKELKHAGFTLSADILLRDMAIGEVALQLEKYSPDQFDGNTDRKIENAPFTYSQKQFLLYNRHSISRWYAHFMVFSPAGFDKNIVEAAMEHICGAHDVFNLSFDFENDLQRYRKEGKQTFSFHYIDLSDDVTKGNDEAALMDKECEIRLTGSNMQDGPLLDILLFHTPHGDHLLFAVNQMIMDGYSLVILIEDFACVYQQFEAGVTVDYSKVGAAFLTWADILDRRIEDTFYSQDLFYWQKVLQTRVTPLPVDTEEAGLTGWEVRSAAIEAKNVVSLEALLLGALNVGLMDWTGGTCFRVEKITHGRDGGTEPDISRTIGPFANDYPFILEAEEVRHLVESGDEKRAMQILADSIRHRLDLVPNQGLGYSTMFETRGTRDILFNFFGDMGRVLEKLPFFPSPAGLNSFGDIPIIRDYRLHIYALVMGGELSITAEFNTNLFSGEVIERLLDGMVRRIGIYEE